VIATRCTVKSSKSVRQTDVRSSDGRRSAILTEKLVGINSNLDDVVEERKDGSKWKRSRKESYKTKLQNCNDNRTSFVSIINQTFYIHVAKQITVILYTCT